MARMIHKLTDYLFIATIVTALALGLMLFIAEKASAQGEWAYTLEDQNEPEYLALRTQYGTFRIQPEAHWTCLYVLPNQNVHIEEWDISYMSIKPDGDPWVPTCIARIEAQMDESPCFTNGAGDCDVWVENY